MRKFILVASLLLASGAAQAGQMRGLTLASNTAQVEQPAQSTPSPVRQQPQKADTKADASGEAKSDCYRDDRDSYRDDGSERRPARHHESSEHKARRIAAKYGIYW